MVTYEQTIHMVRNIFIKSLWYRLYKHTVGLVQQNQMALYDIQRLHMVSSTLSFSTVFHVLHDKLVLSDTSLQLYNYLNFISLLRTHAQNLRQFFDYQINNSTLTISF